MDNVLDPRALYRLPWTLQDNAIAWLEPTMKCNLACDGCYRANVAQHKSLKEVAADLDVFARYRNFDSVSIAGGDPLTHPQIVEIVRMIADRGWQPTLNTNGLALDEGLLRELKRAGVRGFTFHIDSRQNRPGWKNKTEQQTCELRLHYAEMVARVGGGELFSVFNSTVFEDTLDAVPDLVDWAQEHIDIVHGMVFITYREAILHDRYDYEALGQKVDPASLVYAKPEKSERIDLSTPEVVAKIRERHPDFAPCAYLGGTQQADSFKWLLTVRIGTKKKIYGYLGPRMMELLQSYTHATHGTYRAYSSPRVSRSGRSILAAAWPLDAGIRRAALRAVSDPSLLLSRAHVQAIVNIQPIDILADGRQNMCDGCPDITVHDGRLVWSCRLEECLKYGCFLTTAPKAAVAARMIKQPADELSAAG